jgi:hypothetical protein
MKKTRTRHLVYCLWLIALVTALGLNPQPANAETYQYTINSGSYEIKDAGDGRQEIMMEGFGQLLDPGKPKLPSRIFNIAIPPGVRVNSVDAVGMGLTELEGTYRIVPAPVVNALSASEEEIELNRLEYEAVVKKAFESDAPYPNQAGGLKNQGAYRKYNLVQVRYSPFYYQAKSGKLYLYPSLNVTVDYSYASDLQAESAKIMQEFIPEVEERAVKSIINYHDAQQWYPRAVDDAIATTGGFVIITTDDLEESVWPIKNWETCKGRDVHVETVEDINAAYSGADPAERIRNFLRAYLGTWNILKVMLVGDISDVPMRYTYPRGSDGNGNGTHWEEGDRVPTDYYYAELSWPDSTSWNSNRAGNDLTCMVTRATTTSSFPTRWMWAASHGATRRRWKISA